LGGDIGALPGVEKMIDVSLFFFLRSGIFVLKESLKTN
jgi:hypothetical protein